MSARPVVSIVMPARNCAPYINDALKSLVDQTYGDYELIVIDDASTDDTRAIVRSNVDKRIRLVCNESHKGFVASLRLGIEASRGRYIARMDADDVSDIHRLEYQTSFLDRNGSIGAVGSQVAFFKADADSAMASQRYTLPLLHEDIRAGLLFGNTMAHASLMIRSPILKSGLYDYDDGYHTSHEDQDLVYSISADHKMENLDVVLYRVRSTPGSMTRCNRDLYERDRRRFFNRIVEDLGINPTDAAYACHTMQLRDLKDPRERGEMLREIASWYNQLFRAIQATSVLPSDAARRALSRRLFSQAVQARLGARSIYMYYSSNLTTIPDLSIREHAALAYHAFK